MSKYQLDSDEVTLVECEDVSRINEKGKRAKGDLVLTNKRMIWITKSFLGRSKNIQQRPLETIKQYRNQVQVRAEEKFGEATSVRVFFDTADITYEIDEKQKARKLIQGINEVLTGSPYGNIVNSSIENLANSIAGTANTVLSAFSKYKKPQYVACTCEHCGANISGNKDTLVKCPYCGYDSVL